MLNKKQILIAGLAGLASCILVSSASAVVPGPYVGGQLGWGNVHQGGFSKSQLNSAYQAATGFAPTSTSSSSKSTGLAGRVFAGYQFNDNWAAELGFMKFHNATAKASASTTVPGSTLASGSANGTIKTNAVDLVGKGIYPLQNGFNVYGKLGLAYLSASGKVNANSSSALGPNVSASASKSAHAIYPELGVGVGYDITQNWVADVSYTRIQKVGGNKNLNSTDFVGLGLSYHFG